MTNFVCFKQAERQLAQSEQDSMSMLCARFFVCAFKWICCQHEWDHKQDKHICRCHMLKTIVFWFLVIPDQAHFLNVYKQATVHFIHSAVYLQEEDCITYLYILVPLQHLQLNCDTLWYPCGNVLFKQFRSDGKNEWAVETSAQSNRLS